MDQYARVRGCQYLVVDMDAANAAFHLIQSLLNLNGKDLVQAKGMSKVRCPAGGFVRDCRYCR